MEPNIINNSNETIRFAWRGYIYLLEPGVPQNLSKIAYDALMKRFPNQLKPFKGSNNKPKKRITIKEIEEDAVN